MSESENECPGDREPPTPPHRRPPVSPATGPNPVPTPQPTNLPVSPTTTHAVNLEEKEVEVLDWDESDDEVDIEDDAAAIDVAARAMSSDLSYRHTDLMPGSRSTTNMLGLGRSAAAGHADGTLKGLDG